MERSADFREVRYAVDDGLRIGAGCTSHSELHRYLLREKWWRGIYQMVMQRMPDTTAFFRPDQSVQI